MNYPAASKSGCQQRGFSLLEVIVAMALATVLLGSVWSLFQILTKRQAIELQQAESNQLIRALHQRFTRDLNNLPAIDRRAVSPVPAIGRDAMPDGRLFWPFNLLDSQTSEASSSNPTVLRGNQSMLTLAQFVEPCEWEDLSEPDAPTRRGGLDSKPPPLIKEVVYQLPRWPNPEDDWSENGSESDQESLNDDMENNPAPPMLSREEHLSLEGVRHSARLLTADVEKRGDQNSIGQSSRDQDLKDEGPEQQLDVTVQRETLDDISVAAFAYFDGQRWRQEWDTELEQRLPVAIRFRWRQSAIPTTESGEASIDFSVTMPPPELNPPTAAVESDIPEPEAYDSAPDSSAETLESRWYEGEWIFLLQPSLPPAGGHHG